MSSPAHDELVEALSQGEVERASKLSREIEGEKDSPKSSTRKTSSKPTKTKTNKKTR